MKKILLMAAAMLFACTANLFAEEELSWVGDGTASRPYEVSSAEHFRAINTKGLNPCSISMLMSFEGKSLI